MSPIIDTFMNTRVNNIEFLNSYCFHATEFNEKNCSDEEKKNV